MPYFGQYVSKAAAEQLLQYQYKGSDDSLLLKYVLNPVYARVVELFPTWLAPNVITLIGFSFTLMAHVLMYIYCPRLEGDAPPAVYIFNGLAVLAYHCFDNLDGRQARRTGSGSPLGLLCDHGCDALNTTVMMINFACTLQLGPSLNSALLWAVAALGFFAATLEEYYTGVLHLPSLNAPNEGLWITAAAHIATAFLPSGWWTKPREMLIGFAPNIIVLYSMTAAGLFTLVGNAIAISKCTRNRRMLVLAKHKSGEDDGLSQAERESSRLWVASTRFVPLVLIGILLFVWVCWSPSDLLSRHPRCVLWTFGIAVSKLVTGIMLAHLCDQEYHPLSRTIACVLILLGHGVLSIVFMPSMDKGTEGLWATQESVLLFEMFGILSLSYIHLVYNVTYEMCAILKIHAFSIRKSKNAKSC